MSNVEPPAHARMLLKTFTDTEYSRHPEEVMIKRDKNLRKEMANDSVGKVVCPVVLVGCARQWVLGPVVEGVDVSPQPRVDMESSVHPVHAE